ncbi:hypothetical protein K3172_12885 [Qipengyuania sp. 6B39]|uniref:hypothetical protein n=1 Tax=Qipengyuania proteolytica TaxID=2867239 RepID=UPI001C89392E|nr:hypothetical protein [Qipengyuania proteolytica]MBX7496754.1 hypothetical protein [Qipengyuania proteolytica]
MTSQFPDWLRQCAAAGQGGLTLPPIDRALSYPLTVKIPLDASADSFSASLRLSPDADGATLADFAVSVGAWDGTYTPVTFTLTKAQVAALPADADGDGLAELVFDILRTPSGSYERRYLAGNVFISGKVTEGA